MTVSRMFNCQRRRKKKKAKRNFEREKLLNSNLIYILEQNPPENGFRSREKKNAVKVAIVVCFPAFSANQLSMVVANIIL